MKRHIPNFLTCLNILTGVVGIAIVAQGGNVKMALIFVLIASAFDFLDGLSAKLLNVQSEMGKQLDSLADLVSFGVLPAIALYYLMNEFTVFGFRIPTYEPLAFVVLLIVPFSALRLAKFNLATDQADEFRGLPTPANALMITSLIYFHNDLFFELSNNMLVAIALASCLLLVSNLPMIAFKFQSMGWKGNELRYSLILVVFIGLAIFQWSFVPFVIPAYILISILGNYMFKVVVS